jgi:hypothetical protein
MIVFGSQLFKYGQLRSLKSLQAGSSISCPFDVVSIQGGRESVDFPTKIRGSQLLSFREDFRRDIGI